MSIIAASTGITLTATHMVIFAELTWTPSIMIQAEDRVHRIGQKSEFVDIKYLYGEETLDDFVCLNFKDCKKYPIEGPIIIKKSIMNNTKSLKVKDNFFFGE